MNIRLHFTRQHIVALEQRCSARRPTSNFSILCCSRRRQIRIKLRFFFFSKFFSVSRFILWPFKVDRFVFSLLLLPVFAVFCVNNLGRTKTKTKHNTESRAGFFPPLTPRCFPQKKIGWEQGKGVFFLSYELCCVNQGSEKKKNEKRARERGKIKRPFSRDPDTKCFFFKVMWDNIVDLNKKLRFTVDADFEKCK